MQKCFRSPPTVSTHDGLIYDRANSLSPSKLDPSKLCHVSTTSSALQATAARAAHGRVIVNDTQPVINDTTDLSEGLLVINDDLRGCPFNQRLMTYVA